jgi:hypothetical protein
MIQKNDGLELLQSYSWFILNGVSLNVLLLSLKLIREARPTAQCICMIMMWLEEQKEENVKELRLKNDGTESST